MRCAREHFRIVWAALTLLREVGGRAAVVRVVHVSGTIKKVERAAVARAQADIARVRGEGGDGGGGVVMDAEDEEWGMEE